LTGDLGRAFKVHNLDHLKVLAGSTMEIEMSKNKDLFDNWSKGVDWNPEKRYDVPGTCDEDSPSCLDCFDGEAQRSFHMVLKTLEENPSPLVRQVAGFIDGMTQHRGDFIPCNATSLGCRPG
jgi:hypothetical protein